MVKTKALVKKGCCHQNTRQYFTFFQGEKRASHLKEEIIYTWDSGFAFPANFPTSKLAEHLRVNHGAVKCTPRKTNMEPENWWLEDYCWWLKSYTTWDKLPINRCRISAIINSIFMYFPFGMAYFSGAKTPWKTMYELDLTCIKRPRRDVPLANMKKTRHTFRSSI